MHKSSQWYTRKHIAIDFCGVVCTDRTEYEEGRITGQIRNEAWRAINRYLDQGYKVIIQTARHDLEQVKLWMLFEEKKTSRSGIVARLDFARKPMAFISIDDRALQFRGTFPSIEEIESFKTWQSAVPRQTKNSDFETIGPSQSKMSIEETLATMSEEGSQQG